MYFEFFLDAVKHCNDHDLPLNRVRKTGLRMWFVDEHQPLLAQAHRRAQAHRFAA